MVWLALCLTLGLGVLTAPGCSCSSDDTAQSQDKKDKKKEKKKKEAKKPFAVKRLSTLPSDEKQIATLVKEGHWVAIRQPTISNNQDFPGEIEAASVDRYGKPLAVERTRFGTEVTRPASLPKGQMRAYESIVYVPRLAKNDKPWLKSQLRNRETGRVEAEDVSPTVKLGGYENFMLVLASSPSAYGYVKTLHTVKPPSDDLDLSRTVRYYRVSMPKLESPLPIPSHSLAWTTTAVVVWDDVDPELLSFDQQQALVDWLHFGGQLVIVGPRSLPKLADSFLTKYLPAKSGGDGDLAAADFAELNENYSTQSRRYRNEPSELNLEGKPLRGVALALQEAGEFVPGTGELVAERRIGRGRICVTAFSLTDRRVKNWPNVDNFFNCVLLRRPAREYRQTSYDEPLLTWSKPELAVADARISSNLRYFVRDVGQGDLDLPTVNRDQFEEDELDDFYWSDYESDPNSIWDERPSDQPVRPDDGEYFRFRGYEENGKTGVAAWNDFSGASNAARASLRQSSGIDVPKVGFVAQVLGVYLLVLVPLNWLVFRLIGRVEWAWIAAPVIAVVGAFAVARLAQLDIGFVRSRTEVVVVEAFGDYERAHVSRYAALYTSLSSFYDVSFNNDHVLVQPFAPDAEFGLRPGETAETLQLSRGKDQVLRGFPVSSNTTDLIRSEQLVGLGGAFSLDTSKEQWRLINNSEMNLQDAAVLYQAPGKTFPEIAWLGEFAADSSAPLKFTHRSDGKMQPKQWETSAVLGDKVEAGGDGELRLYRFTSLATHTLDLLPGEARLIGWSDAAPGAASFNPVAAQSRVRAFVLVHLLSPPLPQPTPDVNLEVDVNPDRRSATES